MHGADTVKIKQEFQFPSISAVRGLPLTRIKPHQQWVTETFGLSGITFNRCSKTYYYYRNFGTDILGQFISEVKITRTRDNTKRECVLPISTTAVKYFRFIFLTSLNAASFIFMFLYVLCLLFG